MDDLKKMYRMVMADHFPLTLTITLGDQSLVYRKRTWKLPQADGVLEEKGLRYGENPGQEAALYELVNGNLVLGECQFVRPGLGMVSAITEAEMIQEGKHPGKTNLTDVDNALNILKFLSAKPAAVIVKHNNPCGVANGTGLSEAYLRAYRADRIAAFGGAAVFNRPMDKTTAELISKNYLEVVAGPDFEEGTIPILAKRGNLRILRVPRMGLLENLRQVRFIDFKGLQDGGLILQQSPINAIQKKEDFIPAVCTYQGREYRISRQPTEKELEDMYFGWSVEQGVTSNSVLYVKDECTVGIGTGEQDRVGVAEIAVYKAYTKYADALCFDRYGLSYKELELEIEQGKRKVGEKEEIDQKTKEDKAGLPRSVMISDAFFPFRDGVEVGLHQGVTAVVQPGGSIRDFEVIEACNQAVPPAAMVFTGQRAFKH
ncbi:MAG: IMP cyclohydrolase [Thermodesulfobacteriota bacterium]|jgi:phosphoribosylaminoimidazolecarboxamide formyltransferase/IMP cyclohydrolase